MIMAPTIISGLAVNVAQIGTPNPQLSVMSPMTKVATDISALSISAAMMPAATNTPKPANANSPNSRIPIVYSLICIWVVLPLIQRIVTCYKEFDSAIASLHSVGERVGHLVKAFYLVGIENDVLITIASGLGHFFKNILGSRHTFERLGHVAVSPKRVLEVVGLKATIAAINDVALAVNVNLKLVGISAAILRLDVEHFKNFSKRFAVTVHFFNRCIEHVKVEEAEHLSVLEDGRNLALVLETILKKFLNEVLPQRVELKVVVDTTRTVLHELTNFTLSVSGHDEQLATGEHTIKQGKHLALSMVIIDLLKLVEQDHSGCGNTLNEGIELITMPIFVDHDGWVSAFTCGHCNLFAEQGFAGTLDAAEKNTSATRTIIKRFENSHTVIYVLAVNLRGECEVFNLLKEELTSTFVKLDSVGLRRKIVIGLDCTAITNSNRAAALEENFCHVASVSSSGLISHRQLISRKYSLCVFVQTITGSVSAVNKR